MRLSPLVLVTVLWLSPATAAAMDCPAGYQELSSHGTDFGCIGTSPRTPANWHEADDDCFLEGARLSTWQEWSSARANLSLVVNSGPPAFEWLSQPSGNGLGMHVVNADAPGFTNDATHTTINFGDSIAYRCFIPAQGHSLAFLPTGPWWLTVALLGTGFALQWRYFRRKERSHP